MGAHPTSLPMRPFHPILVDHLIGAMFTLKSDIRLEYQFNITPKRTSADFFIETDEGCLGGPVISLNSLNISLNIRLFISAQIMILGSGEIEP